MKEKIRLATKKDMPKILNLFNSDSSLTGDNNIQYEKYHLNEYLHNPLNKLIVFETDGKIVGAHLFEIWKRAKYAYLNIVIVDKRHRGKGIGTKLMKYAEKLAKKNNLNLIFFFTEVVDKPMHKLATKLNYKKGKKFYFFSKKLK